MGAAITNQRKGRTHRSIGDIVRASYVPDPADEWNGD